MASTNVGTAYVTIMPSMKGFSESLSAGLGKATASAPATGRKAGGGMGSSFAKGFSAKVGAIAGVASSVATSAFNGIASSLGGAISRVDTLNNFGVVMTNLGYKANDAEQAIQLMADSLDGLPTSLDSMASMTQQLAPITGSLEEATKVGLAFNDALLASGKSQSDQNRAMLQYTQMLSTGKVDMMAWRTMQEVIPGQLNQISQAMLGAGKNSTDLYEALKSGTVSFEDFNNTLLELDQNGLKVGGKSFASFQEQAKGATQGIATTMANFNTRIKNAVGQVINAFWDSDVSNAINNFSKGFTGIGKTVAKAVTEMKKTVDVEGFSKAFSGISQAFSTLFGEGGTDGAAKAFGQTVGDAINVLVPIFSAAAPVIQAFSDAFRAISTAGDGTDWASMFSGLASGIASAAAQAVTSLGEYLSEHGADIAVAVLTIVGSIANALIDSIPTVATALGTLLNGAVDAVLGIAAQLGVQVILAMQEGFSGLESMVGGIFEGAKTAITNEIKGAADSVGKFIEAIKGLFNFQIQWPHIPLPHFSISGSINPFEWPEKGTPQIGVEWYAKGGVFSGPSVIGVGESGNEAVIPLNRRTLASIGSGIAESRGGGYGAADAKSLEKAITDGIARMGFYINDKKIASATRSARDMTDGRVRTFAARGLDF